METKYQTAYCDTTDSFFSVDEAYALETKYRSFYQKTIMGHLWCPGCQKVMLSLVHDGTKFTYFRGYTRQKHGESCPYSLLVDRVKSFADLEKADPTYEKIQLQMQRVLRYAAKNVAIKKQIPKRDISPMTPAIPSKTVHKKFDSRLPEKRIDLPLLDSDLNAIKVFYGTVLLTSTPGKKNPNDRYLTLFSLEKRNRICLISISEAVWHYLSKEPLLHGKQVKVHISFCGELTKSDTGTLFCKLHHSQLLIVQLS